MSRLLALLIAFASLSAGARAADWYVDPLLGDDTNTGTTPGNPWRTVTHALATVPGGENVIHLAPGTYDAASGEVYPLPVRTGTRIVGEGGSEVTLLEGGWFEGTGTEFLYELDAEGLTLRGGQTGVHVFLWHTYDVTLRLVDVQILDMSTHGIRIDAYEPEWGTAFSLVHLDRVRVAGAQDIGIWVSASGSDAADAGLELVARDCEISGNGREGVYGATYSAECCAGGGSLRFERCRVSENGDFGVYGDHDGIFGDEVSVRIEDCSVTANLGAGVEGSTTDVLRSTIAGNLGFGLRGSGTVSGSILHGNGDDLVNFTGSLDYTLTNDPDAPAGPGNLTGDPLFTDPANGDYRLRYGSPCVDAGVPSASAGTDVAGLPRPLDGDLDATKRHDMGAHELAPLTTAGAPTLGATVDLELWGPAGGSAVLFWHRGAVTAPVPTVYGDWLLGRPRLVWAQAATAPWPPAIVGYPVPSDPSLVGLSVSFQALSTNGLGTGPPFALTNAVTLTFVE